MRFRYSEYDWAEEFEAETVEAAVAQAERLAKSGDYGEIESTVWVDYYLAQFAGYDELGEEIWEEVCRDSVAIHPQEPDCEDGCEHDWQAPHETVGGLKESPGVRGHGGGVIYEEVCMRCGCRKITDTWAQNPGTGEQGLTSIKYDPDYYADEVSKLQGDAC